MIRRLELSTARDDARALLRDMIVSGELAPDMHVEEIKLSNRIGVSRTPVREALVALEQEGLVRSRPHKGFVIVNGNEALVRESFPILGALEALAMEMAEDRLRAIVPELRAIDRALGAERDKSRQYELDRAFHAAITAECGNPRLLRLLDMERARAQLVDGAHRRGMANLAGSIAEHEAIVDAIEEGRMADATAALVRHWHDGVEVVARWLQEEERAG